MHAATSAWDHNTLNRYSGQVTLIFDYLGNYVMSKHIVFIFLHENLFFK